MILFYDWKPQRVLCIGHRGARGYAPENTLQSFKKAIELGVDAIELDVRCCKSGELVVIHDAQLNRTTNGKGKVKDLYVKDIQEFDAGNGQKVPSLTQALNIIGKNAKVLIELKEKETAKPVVKTIENFVKKGWRYTDFIVISFNKEALFHVRDLNDKIKLGAIFAASKDLRAFFKKYDKNDAARFKKRFKNIDFIGIHYKYINKVLLDMLHSKGFFVFVYTVNDVETIKDLQELGVDGIVSDYPDRIIN
jgi:glycerophosphoryl diester phosphodiesterase